MFDIWDSVGSREFIESGIWTFIPLTRHQVNTIVELPTSQCWRPLIICTAVKHETNLVNVIVDSNKLRRRSKTAMSSLLSYLVYFICQSKYYFPQRTDSKVEKVRTQAVEEEAQALASQGPADEALDDVDIGIAEASEAALTAAR